MRAIEKERQRERERERERERVKEERWRGRGLSRRTVRLWWEERGWCCLRDNYLISRVHKPDKTMQEKL